MSTYARQAAVFFKVLQDIAPLGAIVGDLIIARFGPGVQQRLILQRALPTDDSPLIAHADALMPVELMPPDEPVEPPSTEAPDDGRPPRQGPPHLSVIRASSRATP